MNHENDAHDARNGPIANDGKQNLWKTLESQR